MKYTKLAKIKTYCFKNYMFLEREFIWNGFKIKKRRLP